MKKSLLLTIFFTLYANASDFNIILNNENLSNSDSKSLEEPSEDFPERKDSLPEEISNSSPTDSPKKIEHKILWDAPEHIRYKRNKNSPPEEIFNSSDSRKKIERVIPWNKSEHIRYKRRKNSPPEKLFNSSDSRKKIERVILWNNPQHPRYKHNENEDIIRKSIQEHRTVRPFNVKKRSAHNKNREDNGTSHKRLKK